jgi:hypothetical protein
VAERPAAIRHRLGLGVAQAGGHAVEEVGVALQRAPGIEARDLLASPCARERPFPRVTEVEGVLPVRQEDVGHVVLPAPEGPELPEALPRRVLPRVREVHEPGRREDPVLDPLVVVAVGGEELQGAVVVRVGGGGPALGVGRLAEEGEGGHAEPGGGDEVVVLRELEPVALRARCEVLVDERRVPLQGAADARTLAGGELGPEEIVGPADRVQQVARGEVHVGLVVRVAPGLVVDGGERPLLRGGEKLRPALHGPGQAHARDRVGHVVLRSPGLRSGGRGRSPRDCGQRGQHLAPLLAVRRRCSDTEFGEAGLAHEYPRMHAHEAGLEPNGAREQV